MSASAHLALLDDVIITDELDRRPSRRPDHEAENQALTALAGAMSSNPRAVLQRLVNAAMELTNSDSAGISLLEPGGEQGTFRWVATAGAWAPYCDGTMPREESPCGEVVARESVLLMDRPERAFPALLQAQPGIGEGLLAPFNIDGVPAGTLWAIKHGPEGRFDAEDARVVISLARFASVAHQMVRSLGGAEAGRLESDTRLRALARASSDVFYIMSADMSELRELSGGDFIADTTSPSRAWLRNYVPPEDHARVSAAIADAIRTKGVFELEHPVRKLDGGIGWALSRAVPIFGASGEIVEWFGSASDITARKRADAMLHEAEERQAFLLKLSDALRAEPSGEAIADRALQMLTEKMRLDRCYVGIYRLAEDTADFPHQVHDDRLPPMPAQVRLSDFPGALRVAFEQTLVVDDSAKMEGLSETDRASIDGLGMRAFIAATLRKGEYKPLWAIVAGSGGARVWTQGEIALVEEVAERTWAVMERARAEAALRDSEQRFAQFAASSTDVLWIRQVDTMEMVYLSPAFATVYGTSPDAAMDGVEHWARLIVPEDRNSALEQLEAARRGKATVHEFRIRRPSDGAFRWIRNHDFPIDGGDGTKWVGGIGTDVTDAKLLVEHQSVLLAELQHRVRNIMAMLRSVVARTADGAQGVADYKALTTGRLMALARTQTLLTRAANIGVEVSAMINDELKAQAHREGQYELSGPELMISPKAAEVLSLAIHELATNALKYGALSSAEGKVAVTWRVLQSNNVEVLRLEWAENRPVPFGWSPPTRKGFGSQLIEQRVPYELGGRGKMEIQPEGARAWIEFPLQPGASILETDAPARTSVFGGSLDMSTEASLTGQTVLVLEDDFYLAEDAASALLGAGADVIGPCRDPAEAIAEIAGRTPTAAVLDINLGTGPSFEVAHVLRKRGVPFVFLTGYDHAALPKEFAEVARVQKPAEPREIVRAVAALFQG